MSIITKIDSIPLFTSKAEALRSARLNGLIGFHEHTYFGKKGYMAGRSHGQVKRVNSLVNKTTADVSIVKLQQGLYKTRLVEITERVTPTEPVAPIVQAPIVQAPIAPRVTQPTQITQTPRVTQTTYSTSGGGGGGY